MAISLLMPSARMRCCTCLEASHWSLTASSPPTCTYLAGNSAITSSSTFSRKVTVLSSTLNRFGNTPHSLIGFSGVLIEPSSG
ncbi:hypothetical protein G6F55_014320 [Rhizopus delemar]|nr:hypothetical protein G6F24_017734 [Rhizopus arrhizus]KAG1227470.1 hypothetical protein G6F68_019594 [Rhizopus microsporus]KAG1385025.1 hypothetical protein G6F59_017653 [Rhizopus arrhizus]KAG1435521.1 hypothetical protein G6F55_014320 [Rhizopus delemar]